MVRDKDSPSFRHLAFLCLGCCCGELCFGIGVAFRELGLCRENLLVFVVGDAHRQIELFEMELRQDAIVLFADENADRRTASSAQSSSAPCSSA